MGFNVPNVTKDRVSFGPGVLFAGPCGCCPPVAGDIGAVRSGAELIITREKIVLEQGSPYQLIMQHVIRETVVLTVTGVEWNFQNLIRGLGAGEFSSGAASVSTGKPWRRFRFGGDMGMSNLSLCYRHHKPEGGELYLKLWCAQGNGEITVPFGDNYHEFPYSFSAIQPDPLKTWWDDPHDPDATLADHEHLYEEFWELPS